MIKLLKHRFLIWVNHRNFEKNKLHFKVIEVEDLPDFLEPNFFYLIGKYPHTWSLAFLCPCNCSEVIQLNLLKEASPKWSFNLNWDGSFKISPSVWRKIGCRSHFFIRNDRLIWSRE